MDNKNRKELVEQYKNRKPIVGITSVYCKSTGESFIDMSKDTNVSFNSVRAKLSMNSHPNKYLQGLWDKYGQNDFEYLVIETLDYQDYNEDFTDELEIMRDICLEKVQNSVKIWK